MKLNVMVEKPRHEKYFSPSEEVRGTARLDIGKREHGRPQQMLVSFRGIANASFLPSSEAETMYPFQEFGSVRKTFQLFEKAEVVSLHDVGIFATTDTGNAVYSYQFLFTFPQYAPCYGKATNLRCHLPPTLDIRSAGLKIKVQYLISMQIKRRGFVYRSLKARAEVSFCPPSPLPLQIFPSLGSFEPPGCTQSTSMLPASRLGGLKNMFVPPGCLPPYSPALTLEIIMVNPPLLVAGRNFSLRIFVHSSAGLVDLVGPVQLRSLTTRLISQTTVRNGTNSRTDTSRRVLWHTSGCVPIEQEKFELDSGVWQNYRVPVATPSFESGLLAQDYAIEAIVGITSQRQHEVQYVSTTIDVALTEPPPDYGD